MWSMGLSDWQYFVTVTFKKEWYGLKVIREFEKVLDIVTEGESERFDYFLGTEHHRARRADHIHAVVNTNDDYFKGRNLEKAFNYYCGWSKARDYRSNGVACLYLSKYITKSFGLFNWQIRGEKGGDYVNDAEYHSRDDGSVTSYDVWKSVTGEWRTAENHCSAFVDSGNPAWQARNAKRGVLDTWGIIGDTRIRRIQNIDKVRFGKSALYLDERQGGRYSPIETIT